MAKTRIEPPCARQDVPYACTRGHRFEVTFAAGITVPAQWDCRCGAAAALDTGGTGAGPGAGGQHARNMGQLLGRRTPAELDQLLADRLAQVRAGAR